MGDREGHVGEYAGLGLVTAAAGTVKPPRSVRRSMPQFSRWLKTASTSSRLSFDWGTADNWCGKSWSRVLPTDSVASAIGTRRGDNRAIGDLVASAARKRRRPALLVGLLRKRRPHLLDRQAQSGEEELDARRASTGSAALKPCLH